MTELMTCSWCSTDRPPSARAWPSVMDRSMTASWTAGARSSSRSVLATVERALPDARRDVLGPQAELVDEPAEPVRGLDRVEVLALQVLDERDLELVDGIELADDRRDALEAGHARGAPAALAGDELVALDGLRDEDRLQDAMLADARGQALELGLVEAHPRLVRVGPDAIERQLDRAGLPGGPLGDECGEAAAEALGALRTDGHATTACGAAGTAAGSACRSRNSSARSA